MNYERVIGVRSTLMSNDKYKLDLTWDKVEYNKEGLCKIHNAIFSGPALQEAEKIADDDHISLDFYRQYYILAKNVYIAELNWKKVEYLDNGTVKLHDCYLTHDTELNRVPTLNDSDMLVIDTKGHDREEHGFNFTYKAYVVNIDKQVYNFLEG